MAEAVAAAAAVEAYKDGRSLLTYVGRKIDYVKDLKSNYKRLTDEAMKLYARRDDVEAQVNKDKTKQATKECEAWICRVKKIEKELQELETRYKNEKKHLLGWSRFWPRSNLSKHMAEKFQEVQDLWLNGKLETGIVVKRLPEPVRTIHAPKTEDTPSLHCVVEEILDFLRDGKTRRIGIWGMVGTGKTTIMQNLNDNENVTKMFDIVIWVTVSKEWSIEKVQKAVVERLKLDMEGITSTDEAAWRISQELENKKYLLLLDEVWDVLDIHAMGIRSNDKDSKVVLATRFRDICYYMEADELINVKRLSDPEAWKLFKEKVGRHINVPGIEPIARLVVSECAGLPFLIDRVARTFRKKDNIHLWMDGLKSLRRWPSIQTQGMDEVLEFLKFCYEDLDGDDRKICFLYGALYPEECEIYTDYLLECWAAEGFIPDANEFRDARDQAHTILHDLLNVSLLERSQKMKYVKMNKVLRNMALKISSESKNSKFLVRACEGLQEPPNEEEWKLANRISLMDNKLSTLPETPDCNNLLTLLLQRNYDLTAIPEPFFGSMQSLQVLDLHDTRITSLPSSLSSLICLGALYLNSCIELKELPYNIEALKHLKVLDIRGTRINYLPPQIGSLIQLRCFRMSLSNFATGHCIQEQSRKVKFNRNVISRLSLLEELSIDVDSYNQWWDEVVKAVTEEVASLTRLTSLRFCFPKVDYLGIFITTSPLWKDFRFTFQFCIGYHESTQYQILDHFEYQICKCLKFANSEGVDRTMSEVLAETDAFELIGHKGVSRLSDFGIESLNKMRGCLIEGCNEIETIVDGNIITKGVLECLEKMYINNVPKLESIWEGPVYSGSLAQLTTLTLNKCPKLKNIFSNGMIQQLSELQHLRIEECREIEEIIMKSENNKLEPSSLPKLRTLILLDLPKLRSILADDSLEWPSLERLKISMCNMLTRLPFNNDNAAKLRSIEGQQSWWGAILWKEDSVERRLRSICMLN